MGALRSMSRSVRRRPQADIRPAEGVDHGLARAGTEIGGRGARRIDGTRLGQEIALFAVISGHRL